MLKTQVSGKTSVPSAGVDAAEPAGSVLDRYDIAILRELQRDARQSNADLAQRIGLSPAPTWRRVRRLEQQGVITGYRAVAFAHPAAKRGSGLLKLQKDSRDDPITLEEGLLGALLQLIGFGRSRLGLWLGFRLWLGLRLWLGHDHRRGRSADQRER